ncbi:MAG: TonB-dependent receptor [Planctomycetes bacterium]|nr:TonB-dependent receptor [Planctomycetota bacterium]MBI3847787.1 TonB-dependent receptor [Planctomycetota bacterium]
MNLAPFVLGLCSLLLDPPDPQAKPLPDDKAKAESAAATQTPSEPANQAAKPDEAQTMPETIVTAARQSRDAFETGRSLTVVDESELREKNVLSIADSLQDRIGITVQRRSTTASDPIIRALSGRNLLALVDFNTLSTLWGEGGDSTSDLYAKVDPEAIERIEVIRGPASVLYGSNALGGVLNFITRRSPFDFTENGFRVGERTHLTYGTAAQDKRLRQEVYGATPRLRFFGGYSLKDYDDTTGGRGEGALEPTSGKFRSFDTATDFRLSDTSTLSFTSANTRVDKTHRFHFPNQTNASDRDAYSLSWSVDQQGPLWDRFEWRAYYQWKEDRRDFLDTGNRGVSKVNTYTTDFQFTANASKEHTLTYGLHYELDRGESPDNEQFTITTPAGVRTKASPDSDWHNWGGFLQDEWKATGWLDFVGSVRYDAFYFKSNVDAFYRPPGGQDPSLDEITDTKDAVSGGFGAVAHATDQINVFTDYSRGFRQNAPSFGVRQVAFGIIVPNGFLDPITADNVEVGVKTRSEKLTTSTTAYTTWYNDFQSNTRGTFLGQDWFDFNQNGTRDAGEDVFVTSSGDRAEVHGIEAEGRLQLDAVNDLFHTDLVGPEWSLRGGGAWELGINYGLGKPLRFAHPPYGVVALRWEPPVTKGQHRVFYEFGATIVDSLSRIPDDIYASDRAFRKNPQDPTSPLLRPDGRVPGYTVYDFRAGYEISDHVRLDLTIENLADKKFRVAYSRIDATGTNALVSLNVEF